MTCCICNRADTRFGVLCGDCRDALMGPVPITREQIRAAQGTPTEAALIDVWGGVHRLCADTTIGRALDPLLFSIYDSSISRTQARLALTPSGWTIQDLASANGSYVDGVPAKGALPLRSGNIVRMGFLKFYFIEQATALPQSLDEIAQTARPGPAVTLDTEQAAELGPREVTFKLSEPSGGGAGVVEIGGIPVHLTLAQYELISRLVARMVDAANEPEAGRGFISSDELASVLSLESQRPDDDNVRQLVRRLRRALQKAGVGDMIESRYGLGYRLSVTPRVV